MLGDVASSLRGEVPPGVPVGVRLNPLPGRTDQEVVDVHLDHNLVQ